MNFRGECTSTLCKSIVPDGVFPNSWPKRGVPLGFWASFAEPRELHSSWIGLSHVSLRWLRTLTGQGHSHDLAAEMLTCEVGAFQSKCDSSKVALVCWARC